ncbi:hypothetical protein Pcinc_007543 [Petrolisthes cinctipes]|uniref:NADH dehydrogenase [ubiquinone] 1 beta subcomplex subunit 10 n=1 Tax=Petrolisthes cinctipes TaxID=88211 RepID=A0AAE1L0E4_PETCI|nr:hypothetical protein Pcinc_007543 [Petrolisthes cinctipes]
MGVGDPLHQFEAFVNAVGSVFDGPVTWFRDECYTDDIVCFVEANEQFKRDRMVDNEVLSILRQRHHDCILYEGHDHKEKCASIKEQYDKAAENWFIKYGDLGVYGDVKAAYMKQNHRLLWERRHRHEESNGVKKIPDGIVISSILL